MNDIIAKLLLDRERIFVRIRKKDKDLANYDLTQRMLQVTNASDLEYQRVYKSFYVVRQRSQQWYSDYFNLLEREKSNRDIVLAAVLRDIFSLTQRVEASFLSKLVHTIRPELPVYDDFVRGHLKLPN